MRHVYQHISCTTTDKRQQHQWQSLSAEQQKEMRNGTIIKNKKNVWERTVTSKTKTDRYLYPCLYKYISRSIPILEDIISIAPTKNITSSKRERRVMMSTTADIRIVYVYFIFSNNKESYERKWWEIFRAFFSHLISSNITLHASPALYFFLHNVWNKIMTGNRVLHISLCIIWHFFKITHFVCVVLFVFSLNCVYILCA